MASRQALETDLLIEAVRAVSQARVLDEVIAAVKRAARQGSGADGVTFVLRDGQQCAYVDEDSIGPLWKGRRFPLSACVSGWCMLHRQAAVVPDIRTDPRVPQDAYRGTFVRALVTVPIRDQEPLGAVGTYWQEPRDFDPQLVHWLQALADATCAGLEALRAAQEARTLRRIWPVTPPPVGDESGPNPVKMCAWTRRLEHDGRWLSVEAFLAARYGLRVTHGISEEALANLRQEIDET